VRHGVQSTSLSHTSIHYELPSGINDRVFRNQNLASFIICVSLESAVPRLFVTDGKSSYDIHSYEGLGKSFALHISRVTSNNLVEVTNLLLIISNIIVHTTSCPRLAEKARAS